MKKIYDKNNRYNKQTMTVAELRDALAAFDPELPVFCTWEGVDAPVEAANFYVEPLSWSDSSALLIDVESY